MKYRCPKCGNIESIQQTDVYDAYCNCGKIAGAVQSYYKVIKGSTPNYKMGPCSWTKMIPCEPSISPAEIVARFNELVKEHKICYGASNEPTNYDGIDTFRLRPAPQYRPFNTSDSFKLDEFDGLLIVNRIDRKKREQVRALFCGGFALESGRDITWEEAANDWLVADTNEPFGVKVD